MTYTRQIMNKYPLKHSTHREQAMDQVIVTKIILQMKWNNKS